MSRLLALAFRKKRGRRVNIKRGKKRERIEKNKEKLLRFQF